MRVGLAASLICLAGTGPATADPARYVANLYEQFTGNCSLAFTDPQALVNSIPNPGPVGNQTVSVSPDGKVVQIFHIANGVALDVSFARHTDVLFATCVAMLDGEAIAKEQQLFDAYSMQAIVKFSQDMAGAVEAFFATKEDVALVGGYTPIDYVSIWLDQSMQGLDQASYNYSFMLDAKGQQVPSILKVEHGTVTAYSAHSIKVGE